MTKSKKEKSAHQKTRINFHFSDGRDLSIGAIDIQKQVIKQLKKAALLEANSDLSRNAINELARMAESNILILEKYVIAEKAKSDGGKGGRSGEKRKEWAENLAAKLHCDHPAITKEKKWLRIPENCELTIEINDAKGDAYEYGIKRDGERVYSTNESGTVQSLSKSTFLKEYLSKSK